MRNGYIIYTLARVDIEEFIKIGRNVLGIYEGGIYRAKF